MPRQGKTGRKKDNVTYWSCWAMALFCWVACLNSHDLFITYSLLFPHLHHLMCLFCWTLNLCNHMVISEKSLCTNLGLIDFIKQITLGRTWGKLPLWHKTKLLYSLLFQAFLLPSAEDLNQMVSFTTHYIKAGSFM